MKTVFLFLITGFEEIEAVATVDVLRRGGLEVKMVSLTGDRRVEGAHGIAIEADVLFKDARFGEAEMMVVPGGTIAYYTHEAMKAELRKFHDADGKVAAICAAPAVLAATGIMNGCKATCYPGYEMYLEGAELHTDKAVVVDDNIITGKGPGLTLDFALTLVEVLAGRAKRDEVAAQLLLK